MYSTHLAGCVVVQLWGGFVYLFIVCDLFATKQTVSPICVVRLPSSPVKVIRIPSSWVSHRFLFVHLVQYLSSVHLGQ